MKEAVGIQAKKVGYPIQLAHLKFAPVLTEDFAYPAFAFVTPVCQVFATLSMLSQEAIDVLFEQPIRLYLSDHAGINTYHCRAWHGVRIITETYLTICPRLWLTMSMKTGAEQLRDWIDRRWPNSERKQRQAAEHFGWDETFIAKLLAEGSQQRKPGLVNAIRIERETGIPVEAWVSSELDELVEMVPAKAAKRQQRQGVKRHAL